MNLKFIKEESNRWYIDLPSWTGEKADLEMVCGADNLLDTLSNNGNEVTLCVYEDSFQGCEELNMVNLATDLGNGAYYLLKNYKGEEVNQELWLCDVTKFVFGYLPNKIYFKVEYTNATYAQIVNQYDQCPNCGFYALYVPEGTCVECDFGLEQ